MKGIEPPTEQQLLDALDEVLCALVTYRATRPGPAKPLRVIDASDLLATPGSLLREGDIARNPVGWGLKTAIREIGKMLNARYQGDVDKLLKAAEAVCDRDQPNWQRRMSILNSAFDGIGGWHA